MSTLKKVLSLVLCFSLLAGSFAMFGDLAPVASAAETPSVNAIETYADLDAKYNNFVYYGTEVHEIEVDANGNVTKDNGITDGYVQPGQWLEYRAFLKSDMWVAAFQVSAHFDNRFFDLSKAKAPATAITVGSAFDGNLNPDHPMTGGRGPALKYTVKALSGIPSFSKGFNLFDKTQIEYYTNIQQSVSQFDTSLGSAAMDMSSDVYFYNWYVKVLDEPTVTEAKSFSEPSDWKCADHATYAQVSQNVATGQLLTEVDEPLRKTCINMNLTTTNYPCGPRYGVVKVYLEDAEVKFVLGDAPAEAEKYAATFMNGETEVSSAEYEEGVAIVFPADPVAPAGKKFAGWAVDGTVVAEYTMGTSAVTFVATFEDLPAQTATFMNGSEVYDTYEVYAGGKIVAPAGPAGENGSTFLHWSATEGGEAVADWTMPEDGATFYAVFSAAAVHAVNYVNGTETTSVNVVEGSEYTIAGAPEYDAEAYIFLGWSTEKDNKDLIVTETTFTMGAEDVTYYAVFEEIIYYTVSYVVDGEPYGEAVKYEENKTYEVSTDKPAKTGYTFVGWSTDADNADEIISGEQKITADVVLYAVYKVNTYNATFDANGGAFADGETTTTYAVEYNDYIVAPATAPVKVGYTFNGWTNFTEGTVMGAKDVTYKAAWTANTYKATFYIDKEAYDAGTVLKEVDATYDKALNIGAEYTAAKLAESKPGYKFAGWAEAESGNTAENSSVSSTVISKYAYDSDKAFYAQWTEYDSSITIMVRDYANGEGWTVYETTFADKGKTYNAGALKGVNVAEKMGWADFTATVTNIDTRTLFTSESCEEVTGKTVTYDGDATYYLNTTASATLTFGAGEATQVVNVVTNNTNNPYSYKVSLSTITLDTTPATGYKFAGWVDAEGNAIDAAGGRELTVPVSGGNAQTIAADFQKIAYTISFNVNNAAGSYAVVKNADKTFSIGDTFSLEGVKYLAADGSETVLPTIGAENGEQTGGNQEDGKSYNNAYGKKFTGWTIGLGENEKAFDLNGSEAITEEFIKKFATGETIKITGQWEALEQKLVFYIVDGVNEDGSDKYVVLKSYDVVTGAPIASYKDEASELAKENTPEGRTFSTWSDTSTVNMPAGGLELYARYQNKAIAVYVDYNNATAENGLTLNETMMVGTFYKAYYGLDIKGVYPDGSAPLYDQIRTMTITNVPGENYICVGWDVYTVEDGKDVYDKANWVKVEGIKDAESYKTTSTLIFSANWKAYSDFFFRIYDTNHKIIRAFGKDFKMYYWASEIATDRANADPINHLPDGLVIVLFIPKIEFEGGLTLAIEPFAVNKTFFDPRNFGALLGALGGLLGNLGNL